MGRIVSTLCLALLAGCGTVRAARVVDLVEPVPDNSVRRPAGEAPEPMLVDTRHSHRRKLETSLSFEPPLEQYVRETLETQLGVPLDTVRVEFVGWHRVFRPVGTNHDFALNVELTCDAVGLSGEFEGRIDGDDLLHAHELFGKDWEDSIPNTGPDPELDDDDVGQRLQRLADRRAYLYRLMVQLATRRAGLRVPRSALSGRKKSDEDSEPVRFLEKHP